MSFVGNNRKFPLKDLTGDPETDAKLLREHFERLKAFAPRQEPLNSASVVSTDTLPTSTTWVTIDPSSDVSVPSGAVGVVIHWGARWSTSDGHIQWRMDSSDGAKLLGAVSAGGGYSNYTGPVFFSPGTTTFQVALNIGTATSITQFLYFNGWIF